MICLICTQAELVDGLASALFERGEVKCTIRSIPAKVCPNCGDAVVEENVALELLHEMDDLVRSGLMEETRDYQQLQRK
ncbi:MAG TPA: YgiT-type zinc finger protein [Anaerolineales bacterium]|nr:YgiT-type zinc finger protein [Anaerolineales bacterium]